MIICPNCKEEIDDDSHYCDQCGQALLFCEKCGRVGIGRRCTNCGGLMLSPEEYEQSRMSKASMSGAISTGFASQRFSNTQRGAATNPYMSDMLSSQGIPELVLHNDSLNIRFVGINGAVIGRRQGPYTQYFAQNLFVSGVHAQLKFKNGTGWCIADKHSSNGTRLNERSIQPDVDMTLNNGDVITIANVNLQVSIL